MLPICITLKRDNRYTCMNNFSFKSQYIFSRKIPPLCLLPQLKQIQISRLTNDAMDNLL